MTADRDAFFYAESSFFELDGQIFAQIRAALNPAAAASAASEDVAKTEELAEDFAQVLEWRSLETRARTGRGAHSGMTVAVIERALLGISQHRVGFGDFLEAFFRIRIVRIPIGMVLHGELAISALQFLIACRAAH
jgi:hypothetical protein